MSTFKCNCRSYKDCKKETFTVVKRSLNLNSMKVGESFMYQ